MKKIRTLISFFILFVTLVVAAAVLLLPLPGHPSVLMYHFIADKARAEQEKNVVSHESFARQMAFLKAFGYHVISMDDFIAMKAGRRKPAAREILITFDDGNYTVESGAMPVLEKYGFPVTLFVVSENIRQVANGSMSEDTLKELLGSGIVTLGSHSRTHPLLSRTSPEQVREELEGSKKELEAMFEVPMRSFAYPSGDINAAVVEAARRAGYEAAFTTGHNRLKGLPDGPFTVTRVKISRTADLMPVFWFKLSGLYSFFKSLGH